MAEREPAKKANDSEAARVPQSDAAVFGTEPVAAFVDRLAPTLREVVGRVASQHQSSSEDCPWLEHYLTRARGWSAELGARVLRRWLGHLPETPALLTQAIVFKVRASTEAWFAEGTTPSIVELCPEDVPEATQSVEGLAFVGVADARIAKQDRPIDYAHCEERNAHWWDELDLVLLAPFGAVTPHTRPVVFANQTYDLQKWLQYSDLDKSLLGERLIRDGVFGPRTLLAVRRLVRMPWQEVVDSSNRWRHDPDLVGDWLSVPLSRWGHLGTVALIEVQKRQDVEAWSSTTPTRGVLGFVWRHQLDDSMRRHLTDLYDLPHELDDVEDVELLEVLLVACGEETPWHTENVLYTVDRGWTNKLEYQRIVKQRLAAWDTAAPYFYFGIKNREALGLLETWAAPLPRTEAGTQAMGRIRGREAGAEIGDDGLAALAIGFVLPEIEVDVLQAAVDRVILAPRVNALLESEVERFTADLDRAFVAEEAAQMVSRLRAVDEDPGANPPDITSEAALLDFLKGGVGYDALLTELVEGKRPPFVIVKIGADDAFPIPADRVLLWRQQSIDQKGTFRPDQAPPHAYGLFPHSSKEGETESHRFTAEQDGESIRVVQANVGTFTYDPRQPVRIHTSELWKGVNSFFWLPLVAMGHLGFTTNEQWVFAAALPKVAAALQAQEKAETWSSALDVGFFIFGAGAVVAAPFVAAGGAAVGTASELAMFVGGELAGQWLTDEINAKMEDPNTTPEEREKYQRWMLYAMGAMLVMGVGAGAWRASGNNRAVARAARNLDTFGTVAGPSGARFLRTLAGKVDGYRAAKLEAVGLSEASETSVKSALGRAGDRITHVSDEGLMPGTIKVEFFIEDGLVEPGVVVRTAPRIRLADLAAHRPTIRAVESWAALPTRMGRLQTRVKAWLAGGKTPGSTAFRVDQEITKLQAMLDTRVRWLDGGFLSEAEALMVAQEAAVIARQMDDWAMVLRLPGLDPTRGGLITAKGTVNWDPEALAHWEVIEPFVARHRATVQGVIDAHPDVDAAMVALTESLMGRQISRPVFTPAPNTPQWGSLRDAWRRLNRYASDYAADPVPTIGFERTPGAGRALYDADTQTVRFGGAVPDESTFMHELGHWLDHQSPEVREAVWAFFVNRTRDTSRESSLAAVSIEQGVNAIEAVTHPQAQKTARSGDFAQPYANVYYPSSRTTELTSLGLEWFTDPVQMRWLWERDPDHFALVFGILNEVPPARSTTSPVTGRFDPGHGGPLPDVPLSTVHHVLPAPSIASLDEVARAPLGPAQLHLVSHEATFAHNGGAFPPGVSAATGQEHLAHRIADIADESTPGTRGPVQQLADDEHGQRWSVRVEGVGTFVVMQDVGPVIRRDSATGVVQRSPLYEIATPPVDTLGQERLRAILSTLQASEAGWMAPVRASGGGHFHLDARPLLANPEVLVRLFDWYAAMEEPLLRNFQHSLRSRNGARIPDDIKAGYRALFSRLERVDADVLATHARTIENAAEISLDVSEPSTGWVDWGDLASLGDGSAPPQSVGGPSSATFSDSFGPWKPSMDAIEAFSEGELRDHLLAIGRGGENPQRDLGFNLTSVYARKDGQPKDPTIELRFFDSFPDPEMQDLSWRAVRALLDLAYLGVEVPPGINFALLDARGLVRVLEQLVREHSP